MIEIVRELPPALRRRRHVDDVLRASPMGISLGIPGSGARRAAAVASLPLPTPLLVRFRPDSGLYTLSGSNVVDLAPLAFAAGYGAHATQATAANGPTLTTLGGKTALACSSTQWLATLAWGVQPAQPLTAYVVGRCTVVGNVIALDGIDASNRLNIGANDTGVSHVNLFCGSDLIGGQDWITNPLAVCGVASSTASLVYANAVQLAAGPAGAQSPKGLTIGARFSATFGWQGTLAEVILYQGAHALADVQAVTAYLRSYYAF